MSNSSHIEGSGEGWRVFVTLAPVDGGFQPRALIRIGSCDAREVYIPSVQATEHDCQIAALDAILRWCQVRSDSATKRLSPTLAEIKRFAKSELRRLR